MRVLNLLLLDLFHLMHERRHVIRQDVSPEPIFCYFLTLDFVLSSIIHIPTINSKSLLLCKRKTFPLVDYHRVDLIAITEEECLHINEIACEQLLVA